MGYFGSVRAHAESVLLIRNQQVTSSSLVAGSKNL
jgi:hypothetical protein